MCVLKMPFNIWKLQVLILNSKSVCLFCTFASGVAWAFPGGRLAHPEGQNEDKNEESLRKIRKNDWNWGKMRKVEFLPTRSCEAGYGPDICSLNGSIFRGNLSIALFLHMAPSQNFKPTSPADSGINTLKQLLYDTGNYTENSE